MRSLDAPLALALGYALGQLVRGTLVALRLAATAAALVHP
jgi:hypothetical protein